MGSFLAYKAVTNGHPNAPTTARATGWAGIRTPMVLRLPSVLSGTRDEAGKTKVKGPGRLRRKIRNAALSTRQNSATCARSAKTRANSFFPFSRRSRSMALTERNEQPKA